MSHSRMLSSGVVAAGLCLTAYLFLQPIFQRARAPRGPAKRPATSSAESSDDDEAGLPYPPNVLPGGRDVVTPYGTMRVYEWGPENGEKALLLHGIGTPCLALGNVASELVRNGYRVMLFDLFGRGYSDAPLDVPYDARLYTSQILLALASSPLPWTGNAAFHLLGYSLGGALAVPFAAHHAHIVKSLTLICTGGLIRPTHLSWKGKLLYSQGIFPEWLLRILVRRRLQPRQALPDKPEAELVNQDLRSSDEPNDVEESEELTDQSHEDPDVRGGAVFDNAILVAERDPPVTVADVIAWQLENHAGFVPAYMSTIRHAPIYDQGEKDWSLLAAQLEQRRGLPSGLSTSLMATSQDLAEMVPLPGLEGGQVLIVLGNEDPVIIMEEIKEDSVKVLGELGVAFAVVEGGHEIAITKGDEVAMAAMRFWRARSEG